MKNLILVLVFFLCQQAYSQIVDIPDINFKNALIDQGVDSNGDGEIQESEALGVDSLNVDGKNISSLEGIKGFSNLNYLSCVLNNLSNLDLQGLVNLNSVDLSFSKCSNLNVVGLYNLEVLYCSNNYLNNINLNGLTNLKNLACNENQLNILDIHELYKLEQLDCYSNKIPELDVKELKNLIYLECWNNQISSLDLQQLKYLQYLGCAKNNITILDLQDINNLSFLSCSENKIQDLNVENQTKLLHLFCYSNQIKSLNVKNGINEFTLSFANNPDLKYICCDDFEIENIKNQAVANGLVNCSINSYCSFKPGGVFYTLIGANKLDLDKNGCDISDSVYPNLKYLITDSINTGSLISDNTGYFSIPLQEGKHTFTPLIKNPNYYTISPASIEAIFPDAGDSLVQNFCITPKGIHHDVQISILPTTIARPGFDSKYKIIYKNNGTQAENGTINFLFDDNILDFISSDISPDAQSSGLLSWNFTDLKPFESRTINIVLNVNSPMEIPPVNLGDILSYEANITIFDLDEAPLDNVFDLRQTVVNSVDPNDKTCLEGNNIKPSMVGEYVHYLIRFENTGTYAAENVVVKDVIDASVFDVQSLQITDASHKMFTRINGNVVEFIFEDIQLPFNDANNDGYVAFAIKTRPSLSLGDSLKNKAEIYFDYNLPIITNEAQTLVKNGVRTTEVKELAIDFYPNPIKDIAHFMVNDQIEKAQIYDLNGKILRSTSVSNNELNIQELQSGTYMVRLFTKNKVYVAKVVKM